MYGISCLHDSDYFYVHNSGLLWAITMEQNEAGVSNFHKHYTIDGGTS